MLRSWRVTRRGSLIGGTAVLAVVSAAAQSEQFVQAFREGGEALRGGRMEQAVSAFERCTVLDPGFAEAWFNLGLVRFQQHQIGDAIPLFEKSLKLKPGQRGANLFLGIAQYRAMDYPKATEALTRELGIDAASADALMWLGVVKTAIGKPSEAVTYLQKASQLRPKDVDILYHLGRAHMLLSKEIYERMFEVDQHSWRVHQVLAHSFAEADRLDDAVKECQEAIRLKPDEPGLHQQLADIYWIQNNLPAAEGEFQTELQIDSHNTGAMYSLAVISIERSKVAVAVDLLTEVLRRAPHTIEALYQLGRAQALLSNYEGAAASFAAVVADPRRVNAEMFRQSYYQLAQLYRRLHRPEDSKAALDAFVRLKQQADAAQNQRLEDKMKKSVAEDEDKEREVHQ
jgi:tetratricopeptide (TPR) repeat protein